MGKTCILGLAQMSKKDFEKGFYTWEQICKPGEGWSGTAPCPRLCTEKKTVLKIFNVNMFVH